MNRFFSIGRKIIVGSVALVFIFSISSYIGQTKIIQPTLKQTPKADLQNPIKEVQGSEVTPSPTIILRR